MRKMKEGNEKGKGREDNSNKIDMSKKTDEEESPFNNAF